MSRRPIKSAIEQQQKSQSILGHVDDQKDHPIDLNPSVAGDADGGGGGSGGMGGVPGMGVTGGQYSISNIGGIDVGGVVPGMTVGDDVSDVLSPTTSTTKKRKAHMQTPIFSGAGPSTAPSGPASAKRPRTNTPWTSQEELRLKHMRDAGNTWNEIAKMFPTRTEGSVKKHWYKDMHYAEFAEDEFRFPEQKKPRKKKTPEMNPPNGNASAALLAAIREYDANKWKVIGQKVGKPAKACEQYAKEHFPGK